MGVTQEWGSDPIYVFNQSFFQEPGMSRISANDLKTKGISAIELALSTALEAIILVHGKDKFVVMDIAHYHYPSECELDAALAET